MAGQPKPRGRPRASDRKHLTSEAYFQFRLAPADKALLEEAAKAEGKSLGAWLRELAMKRARKILGE